jgi:hypothetical protein
MAGPRPTDPLPYNVPIVNPADGVPTDFFLRQWATQIVANSAFDGTIDSVEELVAVVEGLLATKIETLGGSGLQGGGDLSADRQLSLTNTAVSPGVYGDASNVGQFTVDAQGRITAAQNVAISGGGGSSTHFIWPSNSRNSFYTGAFATVGNLVTFFRDVDIEAMAIFVNATINQTFVAGVYELDSGGQIQTVVATSSTVTATSTAAQVLEFSLTATMTANTRYFVAVSRTDGGDTTQVNSGDAPNTSDMVYPTFPMVPSSESGVERRRAVLAKKTPAVSDTVTVQNTGFALAIEGSF